MTIEELDQELLDEVGQTDGNADYNETERYRILNYAYRQVQKKTWCTLRPAEAISITAGDESFDLTSELSLTLADGEDVLDVVAVHYLVAGVTQHELVRRDLAYIRALRSRVSSTGGYPWTYAFWRYNNSGVKTPYIDIYTPAQDTGSDVMYISWLEKGADISESQDPITPSYADDAIVKIAAARWWKSLSDRVNYALSYPEAMAELREVKTRSYRDGRGQIISKLALE